jgi:hypothetical protein
VGNFSKGYRKRQLRAEHARALKLNAHLLNKFYELYQEAREWERKYHVKQNWIDEHLLEHPEETV